MFSMAKYLPQAVRCNDQKFVKILERNLCHVWSCQDWTALEVHSVYKVLFPLPVPAQNTCYQFQYLEYSKLSVKDAYTHSCEVD